MSNSQVIDQKITPKDSISDIIQCSKRSNFGYIFAVSSWDNTISIYALDPQSLKIAHLAKFQDSEKDSIIKMTSDDQKLYYGTARGNVKYFNLPTFSEKDLAGPPKTISEQTVLGRTTGVIIGLQYSKNAKKVISVSTDKIVAFWDPSKPEAPSDVIELQENPTCMDVCDDTCFIGLTSDTSKIVSIEVKNPKNPPKPIQNDLDSYPTDISAGPNSTSFCAGGSNSKLIYFNGKNSLSFLCHFDDAKIESYGVNCVKVAQKWAISGGGDGRITYFNLEKNKIMNTKIVNSTKLPITALNFLYDDNSPNPKFIVIACGYDWSRGYDLYAKTAPPIEIHIKRILANDFG